MIDNVTLKIELLAKEHNSYIDAMISFIELYPMYDFEDVLKCLNPILINKLKQECYNRNLVKGVKKNKNDLVNWFNS